MSDLADFLYILAKWWWIPREILKEAANRKFSKTLRFDFKKVLRDQDENSRSYMIVRTVLRDELVDLLYSNSTKGLRVTPKTREPPLALMSRDLLKKILTLTRCNYVGSMSVHHPCYPCALCWLAIQWREPFVWRTWFCCSLTLIPSLILTS